MLMFVLLSVPTTVERSVPVHALGHLAQEGEEARVDSKVRQCSCETHISSLSAPLCDANASILRKSSKLHVDHAHCHSI